MDILDNSQAARHTPMADEACGAATRAPPPEGLGIMSAARPCTALGLLLRCASEASPPQTKNDLIPLPTLQRLAPQGGRRLSSFGSAREGLPLLTPDLHKSEDGTHDVLKGVNVGSLALRGVLVRESGFRVQGLEFRVQGAGKNSLCANKQPVRSTTCYASFGSRPQGQISATGLDAEGSSAWPRC
jgi:hypothetical protein